MCKKRVPAATVLSGCPVSPNRWKNAWLEAHHMAPPAQQVRRDCWPSANTDISKSIFDPANEPPGAYHERVLSESDSGREVEDDCNLPTMQTLPAGAKTNRVPHILEEARRHIIKGGDSAGLIDASDLRGCSPRGRLVRSFRWPGGGMSGGRAIRRVSSALEKPAHFPDMTICHIFRLLWYHYVQITVLRQLDTIRYRFD